MTRTQESVMLAQLRHVHRSDEQPKPKEPDPTKCPLCGNELIGPETDGRVWCPECGYERGIYK